MGCEADPFPRSGTFGDWVIWFLVHFQLLSGTRQPSILRPKPPLHKLGATHSHFLHTLDALYRLCEVESPSRKPPIPFPCAACRCCEVGNHKGMDWTTTRIHTHTHTKCRHPHPLHMSYPRTHTQSITHIHQRTHRRHLILKSQYGRTQGHIRHTWFMHMSQTHRHTNTHGCNLFS